MSVQTLAPSAALELVNAGADDFADLLTGAAGTLSRNTNPIQLGLGAAYSAPSRHLYRSILAFAPAAPPLNERLAHVALQFTTATWPTGGVVAYLYPGRDDGDSDAALWCPTASTLLATSTTLTTGETVTLPLNPCGDIAAEIAATGVLCLGLWHNLVVLETDPASYGDYLGALLTASCELHLCTTPARRGSMSMSMRLGL